MTNTWLTADDIAARLGCVVSYVKRLAREGRVALRPGGPRGAMLYALEHVAEAIQGAEIPRHGEQSLEAVVGDSDDGDDEEDEA